MAGKYQPSKPNKIVCLLLMTIVMCVLYLPYPQLTYLMNGQYFKPGMWLTLAFFVRLFPKIHPKAKLRFGGFLNWWAFNFAVIFIVVSVFAGFFEGFGRSPYSHSLSGMAENILVIGIAMIGREVVRNFILTNLTKSESYLTFILVTLFMTFSDLRLNSFSNLTNTEDIVKYLAQHVIPEFSKNLFATYLVYLGGPSTGMIYLGTVQAFNWLSPILPDLRWIIAAFVGVLCPVFSLMVMHNLYDKAAKIGGRPSDDKDEATGWMITSLASIAIIWFVVGVFPVFPSVIATGSMEPVIRPGDVILVKKVADIGQLKVGDVIQFKRDNILISHRIIQEQADKGSKTFRTKGDNNSAPDSDLVKLEQVKGRVIQVVPKVGWPTLLFKSKPAVTLKKVQF